MSHRRRIMTIALQHRQLVPHLPRLAHRRFRTTSSVRGVYRSTFTGCVGDPESDSRNDHRRRSADIATMKEAREEFQILRGFDRCDPSKRDEGSSSIHDYGVNACHLYGSHEHHEGGHSLGSTVSSLEHDMLQCEEPIVEMFNKSNTSPATTNHLAGVHRSRSSRAMDTDFRRASPALSTTTLTECMSLVVCSFCFWVERHRPGAWSARLQCSPPEYSPHVK